MREFRLAIVTYIILGVQQDHLRQGLQEIDCLKNRDQGFLIFSFEERGEPKYTVQSG